MKTIEERAKEYAKSIACDMEELVDLEIGYRKGATEQRAIDIEERDTAVYNLLCAKLDDEKALWLDKACEWLEDNSIRYIGKGGITDWRAVYADFRKAMEED